MGTRGNSASVSLIAISRKDRLKEGGEQKNSIKPKETFLK